MASKAGTRSRVWATVIYEDSAPLDWVDRISDWHIPCFVSPLHDGDKTVTGEDMKPHRHVMVMFSSLKTQAQAREVFEDIAGVGAEWIHDTRAYGRYLCHLDDLNKCQYSPDDVLSFGGANYDDVISSGAGDIALAQEIIQYCLSEDICYYSDLVRFCISERQDWLRALLRSQRENVRAVILANASKSADALKAGGLDKEMRERSGSHIADENKHP